MSTPKVGDLVTWGHDGTVVRLGARRVLIEVRLGAGVRKYVWVKPEKLTARRREGEAG